VCVNFDCALLPCPPSRSRKASKACPTLLSPLRQSLQVSSGLASQLFNMGLTLFDARSVRSLAPPEYQISRCPLICTKRVATAVLGNVRFPHGTLHSALQALGRRMMPSNDAAARIGRTLQRRKHILPTPLFIRQRATCATVWHARYHLCTEEEPLARHDKETVMR
jgi:hypothetical protein